MKCRSLVVLTILLAAVVPRQAAAQRAASLPSLRAGAAKVDITPSPGELPKNSRGILDRLYARAIVLENGVSTAALITIDAGAVPDALWQAVTGQIEQELKIPAASVLLTATHTHSAGGQRGPDYVQKIGAFGPSTFPLVKRCLERPRHSTEFALRICLRRATLGTVPDPWHADQPEARDRNRAHGFLSSKLPRASFFQFLHQP